jgi:DNA-binding XRE family transcriptional regulator
LITRIKELRARFDMTQEDLSGLVKLRRETSGYIEKGNYNPSLLLAHRIAKQLGASIDELFLFDEGDDQTG